MPKRKDINISSSPLRGEERGGGDRLLKNARGLRKNATDAETTLWKHIRKKQIKSHKFRRQQPIGQKYIVDFICLEKKLIIELDGGQHADQKEYDNKRTSFLEKEGYQVLRFWNNEVLENIEGVWDTIANAIDTPTLTLPPQGGGNKTQGTTANA